MELKTTEIDIDKVVNVINYFLALHFTFGKWEDLIDSSDLTEKEKEWAKKNLFPKTCDIG